MATIQSIVRSLLPAKLGEGLNKQVRSTPYGDVFDVPVFTAPQAQAWEASRYVARAAPVAVETGVVLGSYPTAFSDTLKYAVSIQNAEPAGGKTYVIDYLRCRVVTADTNGTSMIARAEVDLIKRYSSGGTALAFANVNPAGPVSNAVVFVGDVTCVAAGTARAHVGCTLVKKKAAPQLIVDDRYLFSFGGIGAQITNSVAGSLITTLTENTVPFGPCAVPPGGNFLFQLAIPAGDTAPASLAWELAWIER